MTVKHFGIGINNAHCFEFVNRKVNTGFFVHIPEIVALCTEIFKTNPYGILRVFYKIGRPVIENLNSAELNANILNINPAVGNDVAESFYACFVFEVELIEKKTNGYKISVRQAFGNFSGSGGHIVAHTCNKVFDGH